MNKIIFKGVLFASCIFILASCTSVQSVSDKIQPRAAFDLNCPESRINVKLIEGTPSKGVFGATGCDKRISYNTQCSIAGTNCNIHAQVIDSKPM